jgi:hypothetical protein
MPVKIGLQIGNDVPVPTVLDSGLRWGVPITYETTFHKAPLAALETDPMMELSALSVAGPDDYRAAFDDIYARGWTDGLPVIPPKEAYVRDMLAFNGLHADDVAAEVAPDGAPATMEKIAINAVMAGCRNEYLPVLVAAVRAMAEPRFNLMGIQGTTNSVTPFFIINGPIRHKIDLNCGRGALGPGRRANATIGRALRLILINIGGGKPGEIDKAEMGQPGKYTFCLGELEEESPWNTLHMDLGYRREDSTVTAIGVQGTLSFRTPYSQPESILMMTANAMAVYGSGSYNNGIGNPVVILSPGHANLFNDAGWPKPRIREWLFEHTKIPADIMPKESTQSRHRTPRILAGDNRICICEKPDDIVIIVAGSAEPYHVTHLYNFGPSAMVTKRIDS